MSLSRQRPYRWLLGCVLILAGSVARADMVWTVSLDTSQLAANYTGPFGLDFEMVGTSGNTVTLSDFSFGAGGSAGPGAAFPTGLASGDLSSSVILTDNGANFFNDFNQPFIPADTLTFTVDSTLIAPSAGGFPDNFSMVILEGYDPVNGYNPYMLTGGIPILTVDPSGNDSFFTIDNNGPGPGATIAVGYRSLTADIPITVTPTGVVPEPGSGVLMLLSMACTATAIGWQRSRGRHGRSPSS